MRVDNAAPTKPPTQNAAQNTNLTSPLAVKKDMVQAAEDVDSQGIEAHKSAPEPAPARPLQVVPMESPTQRPSGPQMQAKG